MSICRFVLAFPRFPLHSLLNPSHFLSYPLFSHETCWRDSLKNATNINMSKVNMWISKTWSRRNYASISFSSRLNRMLIIIQQIYVFIVLELWTQLYLLSVLNDSGVISSINLFAYSIRSHSLCLPAFRLWRIIDQYASCWICKWLSHEVLILKSPITAYHVQHFLFLFHIHTYSEK